MVPTPEGIVAALQSDVRVSEFQLLCNVPMAKKIMGTKAFKLDTRVNLGTVIGLGEHWLRVALWSVHWAILVKSDLSERQQSSASEPLLHQLTAVEKRARALRRCLYDVGWSETFLTSLFVKGGEAWQLYGSNGLSVGELLHYEPAAFILAVTSARSQYT